MSQCHSYRRINRKLAIVHMIIKTNEHNIYAGSNFLAATGLSFSCGTILHIFTHDKELMDDFFLEVKWVDIAAVATAVLIPV